MNAKFLLFFAAMVLTITSCSIETIETDFGASIEGEYIFETYETHSGVSTPSADDKLVVTRVDDTTIDVTIDYASATATDVDVSNMDVSKSGSTYSLTRSFNNAEVTGDVSEGVMTLRVAYDNGNFLDVTAVK